MRLAECKITALLPFPRGGGGGGGGELKILARGATSPLLATPFPLSLKGSCNIPARVNELAETERLQPDAGWRRGGRRAGLLSRCSVADARHITLRG